MTGRGGARGVRRARSARGFTLVEILVVVVIIAIMTALGMLSIGVLGGDRQIEGEVERFTDLVQTASEQAELEGRDFGIQIMPDGYKVYVYAARRQRWEGLADDRLYEPHQLPPGINVTLELEGKPVLLARPKPGETPAPQITLYASGEAAPYRLTLQRDSPTPQPWVLEGQADASIKLTKPQATP